MNDYFPESELACKCCGECKMDRMFLERLYAARVIAGVPFPINSGYRCEKHNREVGSKTRNHVDGKAVDIACTDSFRRSVILSALFRAGFKRIGVGPDFIHADTMPLPDAAWLY